MARVFLALLSLLFVSQGCGGEDEAGRRTLAIHFDYRFDTKGFFADDARRETLEAAARTWTRHLFDDFEPVDAEMDVLALNPEDGATQEQFKIGYEIDDIVVFVGARTMPNPMMAAHASATALYYPGSDLDQRFNGNARQPWTGYISFNERSHWFFDQTPDTHDDVPMGQSDFLSVAAHELGHVLGFEGPSKAFARHLKNNTFEGPRAKAIFGQGVPMQDDSHIAQGVTIDGQVPAMVASSLIGTRQLPTELDLAFLADLGYTID